MSLNMVYKELDSTLETFFSDIKKQTGVTIDYKASSPDHLTITKITFSDGVYYENANIIDIGRRVEWIAVVDDSTHLFIITTQAMFMSLGNRTSSDYTSFNHDVFIVDTDGTLVNIKTLSESAQEFEEFNMPYNDKRFSGTSDSITLVPAFFYDNYSGANKGFIKNMYIEYERPFQGGLKFIDQNGNRFMTLGGYFLYKID